MKLHLPATALGASAPGFSAAQVGSGTIYAVGLGELGLGWCQAGSCLLGDVMSISYVPLAPGVSWEWGGVVPVMSTTVVVACCENSKFLLCGGKQDGRATLTTIFVIYVRQKKAVFPWLVGGAGSG